MLPQLKLIASDSLVYRGLGHVEWKCDCLAWVWVSMLRCWSLGVASEVAPHLADRFLGSTGQMEDLLKWWGTLPRGQPVHTHIEAFSGPSSVSLSPCCPALNMFTFNGDLMLCLWKTRRQKNKTSSCEISGVVSHAAHVSDTHRGRRKHVPLIMLIWKVFIIWICFCY